jgi:hypothetical protein
MTMYYPVIAETTTVLSIQNNNIILYLINQLVSIIHSYVYYTYMFCGRYQKNDSKEYNILMEIRNSEDTPSDSRQERTSSVDLCALRRGGVASPNSLHGKHTIRSTEDRLWGRWTSIS